MPNPLTAAKLAQIHASFERVMPSTVTIQRQALTGKVSSGEWVDVATSVPFWLIPGGSALPTLIASMLTTGTLKQSDAQRAVFAGSRVVKAGDRLLKDGVTHGYSVKRVQADDLGIAKIADVEPITVERT